MNDVITINIFTDRNLPIVLAQGWSEDRLINGQIKTLTGRTFSISISKTSTIKRLKEMIEDKEGIEIKKQTIMKGKKKLKDDNTLDYYFIKSKQTLLLLVEGDVPDVFGKKVDETPKTMSTKQAMRQQTKVLVITKDEEKKLPKGPWWQQKNIQSGPKTKPKTEKVEEKITPTKFQGKSEKIGGNTQNIPTTPEERREFLRNLWEAKMKKQPK